MNGIPRDVPPDVRRYVVARDRGRCAACGDDGPDLRVDPVTLRLICADCVADGWIPAARAAPARITGAEPAGPQQNRTDPDRTERDSTPDPPPDVAAPPRNGAAGARRPRPRNALGARPSAPRSRRRRHR